MLFEPLQIDGLSDSENLAVSERLGRVLYEWQDTPHMAGQQCKGKGVDCVRFVAGVLDEMQGTSTPTEHLPQDASFHVREKCILAFRRFLTTFQGIELPEGSPVQPGDVIVTGPASGGPGHAIIVGTDGRLWQTLRTVQGYSPDILGTGPYKYKTTLRIKDRTLWQIR